MIKLINLVTIVIFATGNGACSWKAQGMAQEYSLSDKNACELYLGQNEKLLEGTYDKVRVYTEEGESYKFRGKICDNSVLVEIETNSSLISKISIIDVGFCYKDICIGKAFEDVQKLLPEAKLFFSGEEGGIFILEATNGVRYDFSTGGLSIDCYVDQKNCIDKIKQAKLKAIVI